MFIRLEAGWTREKFFNAFELSAWVAFGILVENALILLLPMAKEVKG